MKMKWKDAKGMFSSGQELWVGQVKVGGVFWDSLQSKGSNLNHKIYTNLPSWVPTITNYKTEDEAKRALERFTKRWFEVLTKEKSDGQ